VTRPAGEIKNKNMICNFSAIDTETTGFLNEDPEICEIAIAKVRELKIVERYVKRFKPNKPISKGASRVSGIYDSDLEFEPSIEDHLAEIYKLLSSGDVIVGWNNAKFDNPVIKLEFDRYDFPFPSFETYDALNIFRGIVDRAELESKTGSTTYSLSNVAKFFGLDTSKAHSAMGDVVLTVEVMKKTNEYIVNKESSIKTTKQRTTTDLFNLAIDSSTKSIKKWSDEASKIAIEIIHPIDSDDDASKAAKRILDLQTIVLEIGKEKAKSLKNIKSVVAGINALYAEFCLSPINSVIESIKSDRSKFLERKMMQASSIKIEAEKKAEEIGDAIFNALKTSNLDKAIEESNSAYQKVIETEGSKADTVAKSEFVGNKVIYNEIVFSAKVTDPQAVPVEFLSPDVEKIQKHAKLMYDSFGIEVSIQGVELSHKFEIKKVRPKT
jgi:DNA polymerase III epsilon subunit-like protein